MKFRIHKVSPEFVKALEARGYKNVPPEDLVKMRIHKVSPEEMDQLKTLGFGGMSIDQLVKFRIHKVTPEYIRSMKDVGFTAVSEEQLVRMRIHKVDALFIRHAREDGLTVQTPGEAVDLAIHGPPETLGAYVRPCVESATHHARARTTLYGDRCSPPFRDVTVGQLLTRLAASLPDHQALVYSDSPPALDLS